jgi:hypothetical protein
MVIRWNGDETEMSLDYWGRAQAFEALMKYSWLEYPPFDELVRSLAGSDSYSARQEAGQARAALRYSFRLVDTIRFLFALRQGVAISEEYPTGETRDIIWRPDEAQRWRMRSILYVASKRPAAVHRGARHGRLTLQEYTDSGRLLKRAHIGARTLADVLGINAEL